MRTSRKTDFTRTKTSARLKITFVDMTYPDQRPEPQSLSPHFLLPILNCQYLRGLFYFLLSLYFFNLLFKENLIELQTPLERHLLACPQTALERHLLAPKNVTSCAFRNMSASLHNFRKPCNMKYPVRIRSLSNRHAYSAQ